MDRNFKNYEGKKVYLVLTNNRNYSGMVIEADEFGISLLDKYGNNVYINNTMIGFIEEEKE